jgi:hypothetical protein
MMKPKRKQNVCDKFGKIIEIFDEAGTTKKDAGLKFLIFVLTSVLNKIVSSLAMTQLI